MARGGPKTRCSGAWTDAKYRSFIKGNLRRSTMKWAPISQCLSAARTKRGFYRCAGCGEEVPASILVGRKRTKFVHVDHIHPIIDPAIGWVSWDDTIERMFCELENLQLLCGTCHDVKTNEEKAIAKARRAAAKDNGDDTDDE